MSDNLPDNSQPNQPATDQEGLTQPQPKSPLESSIKDTENQESTQMPSTPPAEPSAPADLSATKPDVPVANEPESTPAPDTDEFLKSILSEDKNSTQNAPADSAAAPNSSPQPNALDQPQNAATPEIPPAPQAPSEPIEPKMPEIQPTPEAPVPVAPPVVAETKEENPADLNSDLKETSGGVTIKDETPDLGAISAPTNAPDQEKGSVSGDLISSMQKNPPPAGNSKRLLSLIVIVVIVAIGGYSIYTMFFAKSKTTNQTATVTATPQTAATGGTTAQSNDLTRKNDLALIQQALINYSKDNNGGYPISAEIASLSSPGNVLEKSLVPKYLTSLPADPDTSKYYGYKSTDGISFNLTAVLDDTNDPQAQISSGKAIYTVNPTTAIPTESTSASATTSTSAATGTATSSNFGF